MSASEAAVVHGDDDPEDDCPLCLEPLPPFWVARTVLTCCGKEICRDCHDNTNEFLRRAIAEGGSLGSEEEQLQAARKLFPSCPMCRGEIHLDDNIAQWCDQKFNNGQLPLKRYYDLGMFYLDGTNERHGIFGIEKNVAKGIEIMMLGAEKGDPCCQAHIGEMYHNGACGMPKSPGEGNRWLMAAAEQGHAIAEYNLAVISEEEGNDAEFLRRLRSSASKGHNDACYWLAKVHYSGEHGLQKSTEQAIRVLTPAAERGDAESMGLLGFMLCSPDPMRLAKPAPSLNPDFTKGMHWLRRAAEKGNRRAILALGELGKIASSKCFRCNKAYNKAAPMEKALLRCSKCREAWYCSKECQVKHWKAEGGGHKKVCIKWE